MGEQMYKSRKKILFILHLPPPVHGPAVMGQVIRESKLVNQTFHTKYINLSTSRKIIEVNKFKVEKLFVIFTTIKSIIMGLFYFKPDFCYFTITLSSNALYRDFIIVLILKLFRKKIIFHLHNKENNSSRNSRIRSNIKRYIFKNENIIFLSHKLSKSEEKIIKNSNIYICANGLSLQTEIKKSIKNNSVPVIIFLSNIHKSKGIFNLLDALKIIFQNGLNFHCHVVGGIGDVSLSELNRRINEYCLNDHVTYKGEIFGVEKFKLLSNADIFVHPTLDDCFPLVLLEAMQYNLPIVTTNEGGITDIVIDNMTGFICEKNNPKCIARKLEELIKNPSLRTQMGEEGNIRYYKYFTQDKFENRFIGILKRV